jgi:CubicO group peptidase (beta-lactamase class C family)
MEGAGVGLAIVRNDSVIYVKGYGVQDVTKGTPVDERTIFAIGSSSKAFTSASVAMLVDEKKVDLDQPVSKYIPGFQLADPYASRELTVRDALSHRSGLARGELAWYGSGFDRDEIVRRVRFLQPSWSFRSQFGYQNIMYVTAGQIVAKASGMSWDDFVQTRIFNPLGMTASTTTMRNLAGRSERGVSARRGQQRGASGCVAQHRQCRPCGFDQLQPVDMAQWVRLQLNNGTFGGKRLISSRQVEEMHSPQTIIRIDSAARASIPTRTTPRTAWVGSSRTIAVVKSGITAATSTASLRSWRCFPSRSSALCSSRT